MVGLKQTNVHGYRPIAHAHDLASFLVWVLSTMHDSQIGFIEHWQFQNYALAQS